MYESIKEKRRKREIQKVKVLREFVNDVDFLRLRYLHFKSLALECAKDFYVSQEHEAQAIAYRYYTQYTKRAEYYQKKLEEKKDPEVFAPFYLK